MSKQARKPIKWVSSAKRDLDAMPEDVKDVFGHAIDLTQAGGKHQDAKVMAGSAADASDERVQEVVRVEYTVAVAVVIVMVAEAIEIAVEVTATK